MIEKQLSTLNRQTVQHCQIKVYKPFTWEVKI